MAIWTAPFADGWNAEQNAAGWIGCGGGGVPSQGIPPTARIVPPDRSPERTLSTRGRAVGWLDDGRFLYIPLGSSDLWAWSATGGNDFFVANAAGNTVRAADGHWLSVTVFGDATGTVQYDGDTLYAGALYDGGAVAGRRAIHARPGSPPGAPYVQEYVDRQLARFVPIPSGGNALTLQADGYIGAGYFGESWLLRPGASLFEIVTVTPWRQEGPPVPVRAPDGTLWLWTATSSPGGRSLVLGRPDGQQDCIVVDITAAWLRVRVIDGQWSIVAVDGGGQLRTTTVALDAPRVPVPKDIIVPPPPPPPPVDPPKPPKPEPHMPVTAKQLADALNVPWDIYLRGLRVYQSQLWVRDRGDDIPSAGAMAYFDGNFFQAVAQEIVHRDRLPGGSSPEAFAGDWNALADLGVQRAIAAYRRDQQPGPEDPQ